VTTPADRLRTVLDHLQAQSLPLPALAAELEQIMRDIACDELERQRTFYSGRAEPAEHSSSLRLST
jgi:hypothetical protein